MRAPVPSVDIRACLQTTVAVPPSPGIRSEKGKSVEIKVEYVIIQFSRLCLVTDLLQFVEALQGKGEVGEMPVPSYVIRCKALALPSDLRSLLVQPLFVVHYAQIVVCFNFPWVALNLLLIGLGRFIQFPSYIQIVVGCDLQLFPLAGMFP